MPDVDIVLTAAATEALRRTRLERGSELVFVIGNGCCDSTAPFLFADYEPGPAERQVGEVAGVPVVLEASLVELFDGHEVVIDAAPDHGGDSFCCETELGLRFSIERSPAAR